MALPNCGRLWPASTPGGRKGGFGMESGRAGGCWSGPGRDARRNGPCGLCATYSVSLGLGSGRTRHGLSRMLLCNGTYGDVPHMETPLLISRRAVLTLPPRAKMHDCARSMAPRYRQLSRGCLGLRATELEPTRATEGAMCATPPEVREADAPPGGHVPRTSRSLSSIAKRRRSSLMGVTSASESGVGR